MSLGKQRIQSRSFELLKPIETSNHIIKKAEEVESENQSFERFKRNKIFETTSNNKSRFETLNNKSQSDSKKIVEGMKKFPLRVQQMLHYLKRDG